MRALRRHHRERMKAKARRIYPGQNPGPLADNLALCSCWLCDKHKQPQEVPPARERAFLDVDNAVVAITC